MCGCLPVQIIFHKQDQVIDGKELSAVLLISRQKDPTNEHLLTPTLTYSLDQVDDSFERQLAGRIRCFPDPGDHRPTARQRAFQFLSRKKAWRSSRCLPLSRSSRFFDGVTPHARRKLRNETLPWPISTFFGLCYLPIASNFRL